MCLELSSLCVLLPKNSVSGGAVEFSLWPQFVILLFPKSSGIWVCKEAMLPENSISSPFLFLFFSITSYFLPCELCLSSISMKHNGKFTKSRNG